MHGIYHLARAPQISLICVTNGSESTPRESASQETRSQKTRKRKEGSDGGYILDVSPSDLRHYRGHHSLGATMDPKKEIIK
jgi:hypothetical protein